MTTVNTTPTPKTGNITSPTQSATQNLGSISPLIRQQAIETALSLALFHTRQGDTHKAVAKSVRAASLLKQACAAAQIGGAA